MAMTVAEQPLVDEVTRTRDGTTARRVYLVRSDDGTEVTSAAATGAPGIPGVGAAYSADAADLLVDSVSARAADGWDHRLVEISYGTLPIQEIGNPLARPDVVAWGWQDLTQSYLLDRSTPDPKPVVNSAGQPFGELPQRDGSVLVATVRRNVTGLDFSQAIQYQNAVNSDGFAVDGVAVGPRQAKLNVSGLSEPKVENGVTFRELAITLKFKDDWRQYLADRGTKQIKSGKLEPILVGAVPTPVDGDYPLDGSGAPKPASTDAPATLTFRPYAELSFGAWGFA